MLAFAPLHDVVGAAGTALSWLTDLLEPLAGGMATAAAIVLFTIAIRLLISPLTVVQVRGERRRAALAPQVRDLQRRYADDPATLQREVFALYSEAGANPIAGCLPLLLQAPFLLVLYRLFTTSEGGTGLLEERLAGVPLGHHLTDGLTGAAGPLFAVLLAVLLAVAWWSSLRARRASAAVGTVAGTPTEGPGAAVLGRLLPLLPFTTVLVALVLPLAAVIYLVTTSVWSAAEQALLRRPQAVAANADANRR
ncbi:YidC/Oxa1 family membrane protein insertase [Micromonospora taraxaci]|uniref:YidC/Oxa1 family membrane protein insertase n=1 Tax=Micromonospora taraxaci TaxID=1316803 RepID=UPI0033C68CE6